MSFDPQPSAVGQGYGIAATMAWVAAAARIRLLAWELPYIACAANKQTNKKTNKQTKKEQNKKTHITLYPDNAVLT